MFSKREVTEPKHATPRRTRLALFVAVAATTLAGVYAYVAPATDAARAAPLDNRLGIANNATTRPWSQYLSERAVGSGGIERDLDGNASALIASDPVL